MDLIAFHYFQTIVELRSITAASKKLFMSQQALSASIHNLEERLGVKLFERKPSFSLTPGGQLISEYASRFLALERQMYTELSEISRKTRAKIIFGLSRNRARLFFVEAMADFHALHPNIDVEIVEDTATALYNMLLRRDIDAYIGARQAGHDEKVISMELRQEQLYFSIRRDMFELYYGSEADSLLAAYRREFRVEYLKPLPLLMYRKGNIFRESLDKAFRKFNYIPNIIFESNDHEIIYNLCAAGLGAGFVTEFYIPKITRDKAQQADDVYLFPVRQKEFRTDIVLSHRADRAISANEREFFEIIRRSYVSKSFS